MNNDKNKNEKAEQLYYLALEYYLGAARKRSLMLAKELLEQAATLGHNKSMIFLGDLYLKKKLPSHNYKEAHNLYKKGCERGDSIAFSRLALCYDKGLGVKKNIIYSLELYEKSVELGNESACFYIASIYEGKHGVKSDSFKAFTWYQKGAELGDAACAANLAYYYYKGIGTCQDMDKAKEIYLTYSDYNPPIQQRLGALYYKGTPKCKPNIEEAIRWLTKAAESGDVESMKFLGNIYRDNGNIDKAIEWYEKGARTDFRDCAYYYAFYLYKKGKGKWDDSFKWMKVAAEHKRVAAQYMLGLFYRAGIGTTVNNTNAFYWFNLAAENGYEDAYCLIGQYYRDGSFVPINYETALYWFEKAIMSSKVNVKSEALYNYGVMYINGHGLQKNEKKGLDYLLESYKLGCINAKVKLKELNSEGVCPKDSNTFNASDIITKGDILMYVKMKIKDKCQTSKWKPNADKRLDIYIQVAQENGLVKKDKDVKWLWTLNNKDYAQWIIDVSDDIGLFIESKKDGKKVKSYHATYFARLFLTKKRKAFNPVDLRTYMSIIRNAKTKEVRNVDVLMNIRRKSRQKVKELML